MSEELTNEQVCERAEAALENAKARGVTVLFPDDCFSSDGLNRHAGEILRTLAENGDRGTYQAVRSISPAEVLALGGVSRGDEWIDLMGDSLFEDQLAIFVAPDDYEGGVDPTLVFFDEKNPYPGRQYD